MEIFNGANIVETEQREYYVALTVNWWSNDGEQPNACT